MTPKKLRLKGFKGIRSGFDRDEIVLDLDALAGDAQQVAIVGPNGAGKSTLLDNLHPYRIMPSRASSYTPGGFSYWDHIYGPECVKELEWEHGGALYRKTLLFKTNGKTKKAEAYLHMLADGQWQPARLPDGTVSDGKTDSYDRCVEGILGKPETFFATAFAAQQRKPLSSYTDGEIKTLLAELLGLERLRETGREAGQVAKLLTAGLEAMRSALAKVLAAEERLPTLKTDLDRFEEQAVKDAQLRRQAQEALAKAQAELAAVKAARASMAETEKRRQELAGRQNALRKSASERLSQIEADARRETERVAQAEAERARQDRHASERIAGLGELAAKRRAVLARKDEIAAAVAEIATFTQEEQTLNTRLAELRKNEAEANGLRAEKARLAGSLQGVAGQGKTQAAICDGFKKRAALAQQVPCDGSDLQPRCPLLKDALEAKTSLAPQEARVVELRQQYADATKKIAAIEAKLAAFGDVAKVIAETEAGLQQARQKLRDRQQVAGLAPQLTDAEETIRTFDKQAADLQAGMAAREQAQAKLAAEAQKAFAALKQRGDATGAEVKEAEERTAAELATLPPPFEEAKLGAAEVALEAIEKELAALDGRIEQTRTELATAKARIQATEAEIAEGKAAKAKAARIEAEIAKWTVLAKAFSTNGIVALAIDDAGPALTGIVNDLLLACYGSRFTVSIKTQIETAKGDLREGFDILVHDAERDETKSVTDMSGGERVWINEALTRGVALYLARESGNGFDTLFSDEADGPLDPERKVQFMRMKREVLRLGGYRREYFVSQTPELWAMADARIDLGTL